MKGRYNTIEKDAEIKERLLNIEERPKKLEKENDILKIELANSIIEKENQCIVSKKESALLKSIISQAKKIKKRTGNNPFELKGDI